MSVTVTGMEMPRTCFDCAWSYYVGNGRAMCKIVSKTVKTDIMIKRRADFCPLAEIPTPHGRLVDADAHILKIRKQYCEDCSRRKGIKNGKMQFCYEIGGVVCRACEIEDMLNALDDAPTVIEAKGEK